VTDKLDYFGLLTPTAQRPLIGLTVLLVEDSRFSSEAIRLLCLRSGARIRRADCIASARRHLSSYRPAVVIVDLGLPDGSGVDLIGELSRAEPAIPALLATSGDDTAAGRALAAGARGFLAKPVESLAQFQETILALLPSEARPAGPRMLSREIVAPDPIAYQDDLSHVADLMDGPQQPESIDYIAQFLGGIARSARDAGLTEASECLSRIRADGGSAEAAFGRLRALVRQRLERTRAV
jgi:CheY-like chemotaxis protein